MCFCIVSAVKLGNTRPRKHRRMDDGRELVWPDTFTKANVGMRRLAHRKIPSNGHLFGSVDVGVYTQRCCSGAGIRVTAFHSQYHRHIIPTILF